MPTLTGFSPDYDTSQPGVVVDCDHMIPSMRGMQAAPSPVSVGMPAFPDPVTGAATVVKLDGTKRMIFGTAVALFEQAGSAWGDITRAAGPYNGSADFPWRFAQFGDATMASNLADVLQQSITGKFSDVPVPLSALTLVSGGAGYTDVPTLAITGGDGTGATGTVTLTPTAIASVTVDQGGTGFTTVPGVVFTGDGIGASGTAHLNPTSVASVTMMNGGTGFTSAPGVIFTGDGTGAAGTAVISGGVITGVTMTDHGTGYTVPPGVSFSGGGGTGAVATTVLTPTSIATVSIEHGGSGFATLPTVAFVGGGGSGASGTVVLVPTSVAGVELTDPGTGYDAVPTATLSGGGGAGAVVSVTLAAAPRAAIVEAVSGFVFLFNISDPVFGVHSDGWWCSGIFDQTIWTPDLATQCANGRIIDQPGGITAGRALGTNIVVYKQTAMYYGTYQGPPIVWAFPSISTQVGAPCQEAVVSIDTAHLFMGNDNFYMFDGTRPTPIGDPIKSWFFSERNPAFVERVISVHDRVAGRVFWYFVSNASDGQIDSAIVYNYRVNKWGTADEAIQAALDYISGQITWESLGTLYATWNDLPKIPWDSPFWVNSSSQPGIVNASNEVQVLSGTAGQSSLTTGDFGDDEQYTTLQYVRIRCHQDPTTATMTTQERTTLGGAAKPGITTDYTDGRFDVDASARWHRAIFTFQGDTEIIGYTPELVPDGQA